MLTNKNNLDFLLEGAEEKLIKARHHEYDNMVNNPYQLRHVNKFANIYRGIGNTHHLANLAKRNGCFLVVPSVAQAQRIKKDYNYKNICGAKEFLLKTLSPSEEYIVDSISNEDLKEIVSSKGKEPISGLVIY